jgi:hypothetical protein
MNSSEADAPPVSTSETSSADVGHVTVALGDGMTEPNATPTTIPPTISATTVATRRRTTAHLPAGSAASRAGAARPF